MDYAAKFVGRQKLAADVTLFRFEKPEDFQFLAGQYCLLSVPDMGFRDDRGLRRPFSIASSPLEKELLFVTKLSGSAMKRSMAEMPPGTTVTLGQSLGALILPEEKATPLAFLAGGVGIAPFLSLCRYATDAVTGHAITLFYSTRTPEETPFLDELQRMPEQNRRLRTVITMTRVDDPKRWSGFTGRLNAEMIKSGCEAWERAHYYIAGPPAMADAMKQTLEGMNIPPVQTRIELFVGY